MKSFILCLLVLILAAVLAGCGGNNSNDNPNIIIRDFAFDPQIKTVQTGTTVRWVNADNVTHSLISGVLLPTNTPATVTIDVVNNQFFNGPFNIDLGDTVRFRNLDQLPRQIEVKDPLTLDTIFLSPSLQRNQTADWKPASAGRFILRDAGNAAITSTIAVEGRPDPDGVFSSGILAPGEDFEVTFNTPGTFRYFCGVHNEEAGRVVVEP